MPRELVGELMDDPAIDPAEHAHALRGLARLNALSGVSRQLYPILKGLAASLDRPLTITDVATGSADLPVALLRRARRDGVRFDLKACDISEVALANAAERASSAGVALTTKQLNALDEALPEADVVTCALFLHHLQDDEIVAVLKRMVTAASRFLLISDLRRGPWGTSLATIVPRLVTRSHVVHVDAVRSARAALSMGEARSLTRGISGGGSWKIDPAFPARMLLQWQPGPSTTRS